jgi:uncharacterized protein YcfL
MKKVILFLLLTGCASHQPADHGNPQRLALDQYRRCVAAVSATSNMNAITYCHRMSEKF